MSFLNQLIFNHDTDSAVAARVLNIYFTLFQSFVNKNEVESKVLDAILTGIHRALPYAPFDQE